jgi:methylmalonyl-CoA mutase N-terminal domain/subunit
MEGERDKKFFTLCNREIKTVYTPTDIQEIDYDRDLGMPGEYPFTRGIHGNMYRGRLWTIRQIAGYGSPEATNQRYKYLLQVGQTGINYIEDQPTKMGLDSDHPMAEGEIGREGVPIDSLEDMEIAFADIPLNKIGVTLVTNHQSIFAMYLVAAQKMGYSLNELRGTIRNDPFTCLNGSKTSAHPPEPAVRLSVDIIEYCLKNVPKFNSTSITGQHYREAGCTATQEMAFALSSAMALTEAVIERGIDVDQFAPTLSFFFDVHIDFFEEIAKFRAGRRLWARIMRERFKAKNPNSWKFRFAAQTAGSSLTAQQPENNVVRTSIQALAAVLAGIQSLHTTSADEVYALPTEKAVRTAVRTQQIIAYETGVINTVDPLGGSYFVEKLTNDMEKEMEEYIKKIEDMGNGSMLKGMIRATEEGYFQREFYRSALEYQMAVEKGEKVIVGVNKFVVEEEPDLEILKVSLAFQEEKIRRLKELRARRDNIQLEKALGALKDAAAAKKNIMPYVIEAVKLYATEGEITHALQEVLGSWRETPILC